jgi:hypothetical protein
MQLLKETGNLNMRRENELPCFFSGTNISPLTGIRSAGLSNFVDANFEPSDDVHSFVPFTPGDLLLKRKIDQCRRLSVSKLITLINRSISFLLRGEGSCPGNMSQCSACHQNQGKRVVLCD